MIGIIKKKQFAVCAILLLAIVLRFWNFSTRISLGGDTGRDVFVAAYGASALQFPLTGPFSSLGQFTFGPWYFYELIVANLVMRNPFAPWILLNLFSIATVYLMYLLGKKLVGYEVGLLMALFCAIVPSQLSAAKGLTNPSFVTFFATGAILFCLYLLDVKRTHEHRSAWILGLLLGVGVNHHYQMASMLILPLFLLFRPGGVTLVVETYLGVALTFLPLLFFDMNNHWFTLSHLFDTYVNGKNRIYVPNRWLFYLRDFWPHFWGYVFGIPTWFAICIMGSAIFLALRRIVSRKISIQWVMMIALFVVQFLVLRYYWGERFMGYLQYLHPYVFLSTAMVFRYVKRLPYGEAIFAVLLCMLLFFTGQIAVRELKPEDFYVDIVNRADALIQQYPSKTGYRIYSCERSGWDYTQALSYVLLTKSKLTAHGVAIGIPAYCIHKLPLPNEKSTIQYTTEIERIALYSAAYPAVPQLDAAVLEEASEAARTKAGYSEISPWKIYKSTTRWWFDEQP